jgi:protein required for attachment to host cells
MTTWIVVADGSQAHILACQDSAYHLQEIQRLVSGNGTRQSREMGSDKPGRYHAGQQNHRAAMEPPTDPQRYAKYSFARDIAHYLWEHQQAFHSLILVAPPKTLGDLRDVLDHQLETRIIGTMDKDLTHMPLPDLPKRLKEFFQPHTDNVHESLLEAQS